MVVNEMQQRMPAEEFLKWKVYFGRKWQREQMRDPAHQQIRSRRR